MTERLLGRPSAGAALRCCQTVFRPSRRTMLHNELTWILPLAAKAKACVPQVPVAWWSAVACVTRRNPIGSHFWTSGPGRQRRSVWCKELAHMTSAEHDGGPAAPSVLYDPAVEWRRKPRARHRTAHAVLEQIIDLCSGRGRRTLFHWRSDTISFLSLRARIKETDLLPDLCSFGS